jgi:hypothetical protein
VRIVLEGKGRKRPEGKKGRGAGEKKENGKKRKVPS